MRLKLQVEPVSAFGSELLGGTLFGQLCWALRWQHSESYLCELLDGYLEGRPFAVVSDAFPSGYLPLPTLPSFLWQKPDDVDRKELKARQWINAQVCRNEPLSKWQSFALKTSDLSDAQRLYTVEVKNSINRLTGTTGEKAFSPYMSERIWYNRGAKLDIYVDLDGRLDPETLIRALNRVGEMGFGADASTGMGKFQINHYEEIPQEPESSSWVTLASCNPTDRDYDLKKSFYRIKTHFGRHGSELAVCENPFKKPILLAQRAAVFSIPLVEKRQFIGRGISDISLSQPTSVHQGYSPVIALTLNYEG